MAKHRYDNPSVPQARGRDIGLWHLSAGLLVVGGVLDVTIGFPRLPATSGLADAAKWVGGMATTGFSTQDGLEHVVNRVSSAWSGLSGLSLPPLPTIVDVELFLRSPSNAQLDAVGAVLSWAAWLVWLWLLLTTLLRVLVVLGERAGIGVEWLGRWRAVSDRVTLALVRQAVDATLAGGMFLRAVAPGPQPITPPMIEYAQVQPIAVPDPRSSSARVPLERAAMAPDLQPGDIFYTAQAGDTLWTIGERFYGDPTAYKRIVNANVDREQPDGQTLRDARFIYAGWRLLIPQPTNAVYTDAEGQRWYTVRAGDTMSGISARVLGDADRYPELFAINQGIELGDGHVLTNPDLIWPGLHLRLSAETAPEDVAAPAPAVAAAAPAEETGRGAASRPPDMSATATPTSPQINGHATASIPPGGANGNEAAGSAFEPTPTVASPSAEAPVRDAPGERSPAEWPPLSLPGDARADLGAAAGLSAAVLLALRARRRKSTRPEPESDTRLDVHAFTLAEPAAVVAGRAAAGAGDDPHGIVLGELLAGELLRHARVAELSDVKVISVLAGRSGSVVTLSTSLQDRPLLEAALRTEVQLAHRVEVTRSPDQDVIVRLQGVQREALGRVSLQECPVLLCLGMLPDSRSYLVGWEALGHVLAATQPATTDAEEHLAGLVATLAGQSPPSELQLYTVAGANTLLRQLAPLPHQRAVVDPGDAEAVVELLAGLRAELKRRQLAGDATDKPELVLAASELAEVAGHEDLAYLLAHGRECGLRVVAATADSAVERGALVDLFDSHLVFGLEDEEASIRLLGTAWALTLAEPGRLLVRLGRRKEVEVLGLHLTEDGRRDLFATMGVAEGASRAGLAVASDPLASEALEEVAPTGDVAPESAHSQVEAAEGTDASGEVVGESEWLTRDSSASPPELSMAQSNASEQLLPSPAVAEAAEAAVRNGHLVQIVTSGSRGLVVDRPVRIAQLLGRASVAIDCDEASLWSAAGRLPVAQSSPIEVLLYLAAAPLLEQGSLEEWVGVNPEVLLGEVWAPRARDSQNRESGQTWLGKNLGRLEAEIARVAGGLKTEVVIRREGGLRLNPDIVVSDVEAFMAAVERARGARGAEQITAAEQAFALRVPGLLSRVPSKWSTVGPKVEFYRWLAEAHWERAGRRLEALGRDAAMLLGRAYRDARRHEEALALYRQLLGDGPVDRRVHEGLLAAAAGTGDLVQLHQAWQQVCVCLGGDGDSDVRGFYENLRREMERAGGRTGAGASR